MDLRASLIAQLVKNPPAMRRPQLDSWVRKIPWRRDRLPIPVFLVFSGGQLVTNLPTMRETGLIPGWEDSLEKGTATHSSFLAQRIPWTVQYSPWGRKESDTTERLSLSLVYCIASIQPVSVLFDQKGFCLLVYFIFC